MCPFWRSSGSIAGNRLHLFRFWFAIVEGALSTRTLSMAVAQCRRCLADAHFSFYLVWRPEEYSARARRWRSLCVCNMWFARVFLAWAAQKGSFFPFPFYSEGIQPLLIWLFIRSIPELPNTLDVIPKTVRATTTNIRPDSINSVLP